MKPTTSATFTAGEPDEPEPQSFWDLVLTKLGFFADAKPPKVVYDKSQEDHE